MFTQFTRSVLIISFSFVLTLMGQFSYAGNSLCPGSIVVVDFNSDSVIHIDPVNGVQTSISSGGSFLSLFDVALENSGNLVVLDRAAFNIPGQFGSGGVIRIDPLTGQQTTVASHNGFLSPMGMTLGLDGDILVSNFFSDNVLTINPITGAESLLVEDGFLAGPMGMAVRDDGVLFIADNDGGSIIRVNMSTGFQTLLAIGGWLQGPSGIAIESSGQLVVSDFNGGRIVRVDPDTGLQSLVASGLNLPFGIAIEADGNLLVTDHTTMYPQVGSIVRVNPITGAKTVISNSGLLSFPTGIVIIPNLPADINNNGTVNVDDLLAVLGSWGTCPKPCTPGFGNPKCNADTNNDCVVDVTDLLTVLGAWGACP